MRTTLSIEDDIAEAIDSLRERENLSLRETVNRLLREGLKSVEETTTATDYNGPVFESALQPGMDPNRMNQVADDLEIEAFVS